MICGQKLYLRGDFIRCIDPAYVTFVGYNFKFRAVATIVTGGLQYFLRTL
jgi:hypothetical protein